MPSRIHDKYLLRQFVRIFLFSILAFSVIYVTVDIFEEIDNFIDHEARFDRIALYYIFSLPFIFTYIVPVSLLLATVFAMGVMARRNELTALLASGVSLARAAASIIIVSILVSIFSAWFNDVVVAKSNRKKDDIMSYDIEGRQRQDRTIKRGFKYLGERGYVYLAESFNQETETLYDVVVQQFGGETLIRRVDARRAVWQDSTWLFINGYERTFEEVADSARAFQELYIPDIVETPAHFAREERAPENMTWMELREYIDKVRRSGGHTEKYMVDLYFKLSFPFAGCIFVLIGIAFASGKRKHSVATGFGLTLLVAFSYYIILRVGQTLGHNGVLPPLLAAQSGNLIFLLIGSALMFRANR
jgi:lipopolysaccharide export system permease protein